MLDYKIKELKKDIAPLEEDIRLLKKQTLEMDHQLKKFDKMNQNLGSMVDDLRTKQD